MKKLLFIIAFVSLAGCEPGELAKKELKTAEAGMQQICLQGVKYWFEPYRHAALFAPVYKPGRVSPEPCDKD